VRRPMCLISDIYNKGTNTRGYTVSGFTRRLTVWGVAMRYNCM